MTLSAAMLLAAVAFLLSLFATFKLIRLRFFGGFVDQPNSRSLHRELVPRTGGVAIVGSFLCALFVWAGWGGDIDALGLVVPGIVLLSVIGLLDDWQHVKARWRLVVQTLAVTSLVVGVDYLLGQEIGTLLKVILISLGVWAVNLTNFVDGMDGLVGSQLVIGGLALSFIFYQAGRLEYAAVTLIASGSVLGFLMFNLPFPRARIFMGDTGSTVLGFIWSGVSIVAVLEDVVLLWSALLIFSPIWVDATVTLLRRLLRGEKIWQAHREHYYQRLVLMGWGHTKTLYVEVALMVACAISALWGTYLSELGQFLLVISWVLVYVIILTLFPLYERRHSSASGQSIP